MEMGRKVVLITGSTDGVGRRVAEKLGASGAMVLIHGRNRTRAEQLRSAIQAEGGKSEIHLADFASLSEVRSLADAILRDHSRLDVLINNAGIGVGQPATRREVSRDGLELRFAVNYLSGFLLTRLMLPLLLAAKGSIVQVASVGQQAIDFEDVMLMQGYTGRRAYCQSKLAQIMFSFDLSSELEDSGVKVNALHPATYMDTRMVRQDGIKPVSTVDEGADAVLNLILNPGTAGKTGNFFDGLHPSRAHSQAYDADARQKLRALSFRLSGLTPPPSA
jgi:NAD(P)-dependent dehydrogenase (short-subunit alcohol dehydrogenase family)